MGSRLDEVNYVERASIAEVLHRKAEGGKVVTSFASIGIVPFVLGGIIFSSMLMLSVTKQRN